MIRFLTDGEQSVQQKHKHRANDGRYSNIVSVVDGPLLYKNVRVMTSIYYNVVWVATIFYNNIVCVVDGRLLYNNVRVMTSIYYNIVRVATIFYKIIVWVFKSKDCCL